MLLAYCSEHGVCMIKNCQLDDILVAGNFDLIIKECRYSQFLIMPIL
jgi:hypothetical protein